MHLQNNKMIENRSAQTKFEPTYYFLIKGSILFDKKDTERVSAAMG